MSLERWNSLQYDSERVTVWLLDLSLMTQEQEQQLYQQLPDFRKRKAMQCRVAEKKRQSIGAGAMFSCFCRLLRENYGFSEEALHVHILTEGKPVFVVDCGATFSLSHTQGCVALAFLLPSNRHHSCQLGMDIERIREPKLSVAKRFFQPLEYEYILAGPNQAIRQERFFQIWTGKEAVIKKSGMGLKEPLHSFSVLEFEQDVLFYDTFLQNKRNYAITVCAEAKVMADEPFLFQVDCAIL